MSQDLYEFLRQRARMKSLGWPLGLTLSAALHLLVAAAICVTAKNPAHTTEPKVTWISLPAAGNTGPLGGSGPMEQGKVGERVRRVEEVAPAAPKPVAKPAPAPAPTPAPPTYTPNAFGSKKTAPLRGTNPNPDSMGKAPVASKGKTPSPNPMVGAAGSGNGGGIGVGGAGIPGLRATSGISGGTGMISGLDQDFPYLIYLRQVQSRITGNWSRLTSAQGRVQIYFKIQRDGSIAGARIEIPSGNDTLDQSALLAVRRSDPLPRLPDGFDSGTLGVRFWFTYLGN